MTLNTQELRIQEISLDLNLLQVQTYPDANFRSPAFLYSPGFLHLSVSSEWEAEGMPPNPREKEATPSP